METAEEKQSPTRQTDVGEMQILPVDLKDGGFDLHQIARKGDWCLYEQRKGGKITSIELIKVRVQQPGERKIGDRVITYDHKEKYPRNEDWGTYGFSLSEHDMPYAHERLEYMATHHA